MRLRILVLLFVCLFLGSFSGAIAQHSSIALNEQAEPSQVPHLIPYSGYLLDDGGKPVTTPSEITFAIYKEQQWGPQLWIEIQKVTPDAHGGYSVLLGSSSPNGVSQDIFSTTEARWIGATANGGVEQPRVMLLSVPYALKAADAETLGGLPASAFLKAGSENPAAANGPLASKACAQATTTQSICTMDALGSSGTDIPGLSSDGSNGIQVSSGAVSTPNAQLVLKETGDSFGTVSMALANHYNLAGAVFANQSLDLVDLAFLPSSNQQTNIRLEHRPIYLMSASNSADGEIQLMSGMYGGRPFNRYAAFGPNMFTIPSVNVQGGISINSTPLAAMHLSNSVHGSGKVQLADGTGASGHLAAFAADGSLTDGGAPDSGAMGPAGLPGMSSDGASGITVAGSVSGPIQDKGGEVFNVKAYGATGNGSTNDCAAVSAANTALTAAGGGEIFFPYGSYFVGDSCRLTVSAPTAVRGVGKCGILTMSGTGTPTRCGSAIISTDPSGSLFTVTADWARFESIGMVNVAVANPAGSAVLVNSPSNWTQEVDFDNILVNGFYDDIDVNVGRSWHLRDSYISNPVRYGIYVRNILNRDMGDWTIEGNQFSGSGKTMAARTAAIEYESSGGGRIINNKIVQDYYGNFQDGII
jgi:hypothetical protein